MSSKSASPKISSDSKSSKKSSASPKSASTSSKKSSASPKSASTSSKKSSASSSKRTSPEVKTILEAIDGLGTDMQEELLDKLMSLKPSSSNRNLPLRNYLPLINNKFADIYSYQRNLNKIKSAQTPLNKDMDYPRLSLAEKMTYASTIFEKNFEKFTTKQLPKEVDNVVSIIGNKTLDKISKNSPLSNQLNTIFKNDEKVYSNYDGMENLHVGVYTADATKKAFLREYESYFRQINRNSPNYEKFANKGEKYYQQYEKDFIELWNSYNSAPDRLTFLQKNIKKYRENIDEYDPENTEIDKPKIDAFLKLNKDITYSEYIRAIRNLPSSVKRVVYYGDDY